MKFRYDKEEDILMVWFSKKKVDYASQSRGIIVHFSQKNEPVLMEILKAKNFLKSTSKLIPDNVKQQVLAV